jgi:hypothetical protein
MSNGKNPSKRKITEEQQATTLIRCIGAGWTDLDGRRGFRRRLWRK